MKTNNKGKIFALALSAASFLSLAGSITGTVAWYQYSTRATAGIVGESKTVTENLQISTDGTNWKSDLKSQDIWNAATGYGTAISPITSGPMTKDAPLNNLYSNPQYQYFGDYTNWQSAYDQHEKYLKFDLYFQFVKKVNENEIKIAKEVKLTDLTLESDDTDDLAKSLRVHFQNDTESINALASKEGGVTETHGELDLNGDKKPDNDLKYDWEKNNISDEDWQGEIYGTGVQVAYESSSTGVDGLIASKTTEGKITGGKTLATTTANGNPAKVTVTIWLEGWQKITKANQTNQDSTSADWDADVFTGKTFRVGMQFGCDPE